MGPGLNRRLVALTATRWLIAAILGFAVGLRGIGIRLDVALFGVLAVLSLPAGTVAVIAAAAGSVLRSGPWWRSLTELGCAVALAALIAWLYRGRIRETGPKLTLSYRVGILLAGAYVIALPDNAVVTGHSWHSMGDWAYTWLGLIAGAGIALTALNLPRPHRSLDRTLWVAASFGTAAALLIATVNFWQSQDDQSLESFKLSAENGMLTALGGPMGAISNKTVALPTPRTLPSAADLQQSLELAVSGQPAIELASIVRIAPGEPISTLAHFSNIGTDTGSALSSWISGYTAQLRQSAEKGATIYLGLLGLQMAAGPDQPYLVFAAPMVDVGVEPGPGVAVDSIIAAVSIPAAVNSAIASAATTAGAVYTDLYMQADEGSVLVWSTDPRRYEANSAMAGFPMLNPPTARRASVKVTSVSVGADVTIVARRGPNLGLALNWRRFILALEAILGSLTTAAVVMGIERGHRRERERLRRESLLAAALEGSPGWTAIIGPSFDVVMTNEGRAGVSAGMTLADVDLFAEIEARRAVEDIITTARTGETASYQLVWSDPNDPSRAIRIFEIDARPLPDPSLAHLQCRDVTEHRDRAMRSAQSERMEAIGVLAGGLAHDFNNLLFITLGYLQMLERQPIITDDPTANAYVARAIEAVERGATVAKSLLSVARSQPLTATPINLAEFLDGIKPLFEQAMRGAHDIEFSADSDGLDVVVDPGRLSSSLLNIAFNARDAMSSKGVLSISARHVLAAPPDGDLRPMVAIAMRDTGKGMPAEVAARAFEPFFTTKKVGSGTGLGLSTVYSFAQQSGGWASIESTEGIGTTVTVFLPPALEHPTQVSADALPNATSTRALVVDDEPALAELVGAWLSDLGMTVKTANSPESAMKLASEFKPELLVSDANLGAQIDGLELARLLVERNPALLVVFMTGFSDRIKALQAAGVAVLAKPFTAEDLVNTLSLHLGERLRRSGATGPDA